MIENVSIKIANWIIRNDPDSSKKYDELVYVIQCLLERIISYAACIIIAIFIGMVLQMVVWLAFYTFLRAHIGGMHAETYIGCLLIGTAYSVICVVAVPYFANFPMLLLIETAFSILVTFLTKPVVHPNKYLSDENRIKKHKRGKIVVIVETLAVFVLMFALKDNSLAHSAAIGMFAASLMCLLGRIVFGRKNNSFDYK